MTTGRLQYASWRVSRNQWLPLCVLVGVSCACLVSDTLCAQDGAATPTQTSSAHQTGALSPAEIAGFLPPSVFFKDKLAPVQARNSGAVRWADGSLLWATMVDTSGYASDVQEVYQFYFVTERAVTIGGKPLPAGAYGAGIVNGKLTVMDVGGHALLTVAAETDAAMQRPRPLQVVASGADAARIYLGKRWVLVQAAP